MNKYVEFLRKMNYDKTADYIEELEKEREFVKENIARRKEMEQMKGVEVSQLIAENAALRERLRLADEAIHSLEEEVGVLSSERAAYNNWKKGPSDE